MTKQQAIKYYKQRLLTKHELVGKLISEGYDLKQAHKIAEAKRVNH